MIDAYLDDRWRRDAALVARDGLRLPRGRGERSEDGAPGRERMRRPRRSITANGRLTAGSSARGRPTSSDPSCSARSVTTSSTSPATSAPTARSPRTSARASSRRSSTAASTNFKNALVFSAGCHSGYNLVDGDGVAGVTETLDWAQAFARKQATLVAGTGYQYGDTDFLEYSERHLPQLRPGAAHRQRRGERRRGARAREAALPRDDARHPRHPREGAARGDGLRAADVLGRTCPARGSAAAGERPRSSARSAASAPIRAPTLGLAVCRRLRPGRLDAEDRAAHRTSPAANLTATYYQRAGRRRHQPGRAGDPASGRRRHAAGRLGRAARRRVPRRAYTDSTVVPLTGAPTTELRGVHVPFVSPVFFPMRLATVNHFDVLGGGTRTKLLVTPAQHRAADIAAGDEHAAPVRRAQPAALLQRLPRHGRALRGARHHERRRRSTPARTSSSPSGSPGTLPPGSSRTGSPTRATVRAPGCRSTSQQDAVDSTLWTGTLPLASPGEPAVRRPGRERARARHPRRRARLVSPRRRRIDDTAEGDDTRSCSRLRRPACSGRRRRVSAKLTRTGRPSPGKNVLISIGSAAGIDVTDADGIASVTIPALGDAGRRRASGRRSRGTTSSSPPTTRLRSRSRKAAGARCRRSRRRPPS